MKIYEYFNDENYLYVVGELIEGGELFDFICDKGSLDEKKTAEIIKQLLSTIYFLHSKNIVHRLKKLKHMKKIMFLKKVILNQKTSF